MKVQFIRCGLSVNFANDLGLDLDSGFVWSGKV